MPSTSPGATGTNADVFAEMSVKEIRAGLVRGDFSAREIAEQSLRIIRARDADLHAFLEVTEELALQAAARLDKSIAAGVMNASGTKASRGAVELGSLAGVPVAFKDNMNQLGTHTTCASKMLENHISTFEATCVAKTVFAGALPLGKLNLDEFAFGSSTETSAFGPTRNPWDMGRVPGGSSGGSAAAVAAGMACVSLGSDTGGSIRQPASFCGVVGIKPSYGMVSRYGVVAFGSSLDQVGPLAKTVEDAALALNAICGYDPLDCMSLETAIDFTANLEQGVAGMKVGIVPAFMEAEGLHPEVKEAVENAARNMEKLGATLVEIDLPHVQAAISAYYVLGPCEAFSNLSRFDSVRYGYRDPGHKDLGAQYELSRAVGFGAEARRRIMLGSYLLSAGIYDKYYLPAQQVRTLITRDYTQAFEQVDCILTPVTPRTAFRFGEVSDPTEMYLSDMFTVSVNIAGNGGLSLPVGFGSQSGLPVGVQLIAPQFKDENMLRAAAALETCYDHLRVAPAVATDTRVAPAIATDTRVAPAIATGTRVAPTIADAKAGE